MLFLLSGVSEVICHQKELRWEPAFEDGDTVLVEKRRLSQGRTLRSTWCLCQEMLSSSWDFDYCSVGAASSFPSLAQDSQHKLTLEDFFKVLNDTAKPFVYDCWGCWGTSFGE